MVLKHLPSLFIALLLTGCNDDLFVTDADTEFSADRTSISHSGGKIVITAGSALTGYPSIYARAVNADYGYVDIITPHKIDGSLYFDNILLQGTAAYNSYSRTVTLNLVRSVCADTVLVTVEGDFGFAYRSFTVSIAPAPPAKVVQIDYADQWSYGTASTSTAKTQIINSHEAPLDCSVEPRALCSAWYNVTGQYPSLFFGDTDVSVPAAIADGNTVVKTDINVPFSYLSSQIPGIYGRGAEPFDLTAPARSLTEVTVTYRNIRRNTTFTLFAACSGAEGEEEVVILQGNYVLIEPEVMKVDIHAYDIESGEELPL